MRFATVLAATLPLLPSTLAVYKGFNYGSTQSDGSNKQESDFAGEFTSAQNLVGTSGFTSARLYTMIQGGTTNSPISAIPAAISTKTTLLLGMWASAGDADFANEITALKSAISQYGTAFTDLIAGISVGSEDLYRISPIGLTSPNAAAGAGPGVLAGYIGQVRSAIAGTGAESAPVGHVDTWTAWVNATNNPVINACDFIGMDAYPYYESTKPNSIADASSLFWAAHDNTKNAVGSKPVWITETGWPIAGPTSNLAVASVDNAATYWSQVGCSILGDLNTWWFTLQDTQPVAPAGGVTFGVVGAGNPPPTTPLYNLGC